MAYHIQKTIEHRGEELVVFYQDTTCNHHHVWTDNCEECRTFSLKADATELSRTICEPTTIIKR